MPERPLALRAASSASRAASSSSRCLSAASLALYADVTKRSLSPNCSASASCSF